MPCLKTTTGSSPVEPCIPLCCSFATVKQATRKGKKKDEGAQKLAVKIIIKTALNSEDKAALETEVAVMEKLKHENIVRCYDKIVDKK